MLPPIAHPPNLIHNVLKLAGSSKEQITKGYPAPTFSSLQGRALGGANNFAAVTLPNINAASIRP